jgi:DNA-directed RNA polymerase specialized sigma24 family protein
MNQRRQAQKRLWIRDRDSLGNAVDQGLREAADRVWERARLMVVRYLADDTQAAEILETAVDSASRLMNNGQPIQFFEAYLLRSVARESIRRMRKTPRIAFMDSEDIERLAGASFTDVERQLDNAKRIEALRACMDERGQAMCDLRVLDFDWGRIAELTGYRDAHTAEVQFRKKVDKALKRFCAYQELRLKGQSSV